MKWKFSETHDRPYLVAAAMLAVGLCVSVVIFLTAKPSPATLLEFSADTSKKYARDLQLYGGTANVLATELTDWFNGLWHGRSLAFTVAVITLLVCLGYLFFAVHLPDDTSEDISPDDGPGQQFLG
jgi:hypothetical protein